MEKAVAVIALLAILGGLASFAAWAVYKSLNQQLWERRHAIKRDDQMEDRIYEEEKKRKDGK